MLFFYIVIKFERGFVQYFGFGSVVFLSAPGTDTIICIQSKTENLFCEKKIFHFPSTVFEFLQLCLSNTQLVSNSDAWETNPKRLPFRRHQD